MEFLPADEQKPAILKPEALALIKEEEAILASVLESLRYQSCYSQAQLQEENTRSRTLTAELVNTRRDTDKQLLASDEAVSHSLAKHKRQELKSIAKLIDSPYFARIVLDEKTPTGTREIEYKLGIAANTDCRIIDWRRAPIAKLYYEYQEGEEYGELILGREREGCVRIRHKLDIKNGELRKISCRLGTFVKINGSWTGTTSFSRSRTFASSSEKASPGTSLKSSANGAPTASSYGELPHILSLITEDQYGLITEGATQAVLIQGIAGSGKTTVALHRLAWLLHEDNSDLLPQEAIVLVRSPAFREYIKNTLPQMGIEGVRIDTFSKWALRTLEKAVRIPSGAPSLALTPPRQRTNPGSRRLKRSLSMLLALESDLAERPLGIASNARIPLELLQQRVLNLLARPNKILNFGDTTLLDKELISLCRQETAGLWASGLLEAADLGILLRCLQSNGRGMFCPHTSDGKYRHIVVDEVQDFGAAELAVLIESAYSTSCLTLAGDAAQESYSSSVFPGWDQLRSHLRQGEEMASLTRLTVSHRSSLPIMRFADHILGEKRTTEGRKGRPPLWIKCKTENEGVRQAIAWLGRVMERFPGSLTGVLCRTMDQARHIHGLLSPSFGSAVRIGEDEAFSFDEGILISSIKQVKGLEFPHVLIWNPSERTYPHSRSRKLLYVAATRAEENLCLVTWENQASKLLPPLYSPLVRAYEPDAEN